MDRAFKVIPVVWFIAFIAALPVAFIVKVNRVLLPPDAMNRPWTRLVGILLNSKKQKKKLFFDENAKLKV